MIHPAQLLELQQQVMHVHTAEALLDYIQNLIEATRRQGSFAEGLSPRAGLALLAAAKAWALLEGREMVLPEDVQAVAVAVITHRLQPTKDTTGGRAALVARLLESVPIP